MHKVVFPLLSYVRSGYVGLEYGSIRYAGEYSMVWSMTARSETWGAKYFGADESVIHQHYDYGSGNRHSAFPFDLKQITLFHDPMCGAGGLTYITML